MSVPPAAPQQVLPDSPNKSATGQSLSPKNFGHKRNAAIIEWSEDKKRRQVLIRTLESSTGRSKFSWCHVGSDGQANVQQTSPSILSCFADPFISPVVNLHITYHRAAKHDARGEAYINFAFPVLPCRMWV
jgi:hypothetical protein